MIPDRDLRDARERFASLLESETAEAQWQRFFSECPYVLSEALPLKLRPSDIHPRGRRGKDETDFHFYPADARSVPYIYGCIELKRPDTPILVNARKGVIRLSADAETARAQAERDAIRLTSALVDHRYGTLALGNERHVFLIVGLSGDIAVKITSDVLRQQYDNLLPEGFRLLPYDTLLKCFEARVPPAVHVLIPETPWGRRDLPIVDYTDGGFVQATPSLLPSLRNVGVVTDASGERRQQLVPGACLYCGEHREAEPISPRLLTPCGIMRVFGYVQPDGSLVRLMECPRTTFTSDSRALFGERYDAGGLRAWFDDLTNGACSRCGSDQVGSMSLSGASRLPGASDMKRESWMCNNCGFEYEQCASDGLVFSPVGCRTRDGAA